MVKERSHSPKCRASRSSRLPAAKPARAGVQPSGKRNRYHDCRALVVEADLNTRKLCRDLLEELGFTVEATDTGVTAVTMASQDAPDLILLDLQLRDVPGLELVKWLRSNRALRSVPMIAISALATARDDPRFVESGINAVLRKPVSPSTIKSAVWEALK